MDNKIILNQGIRFRLATPKQYRSRSSESNGDILVSKYFSTISTVCLLVIQLLWSSSSFATNYYVHPNAGDNHNGGLQPDNAFATLSYAMEQLIPGDTLYLRSGMYTETVHLTASQYSNGTSTKPITIKSYPGETPVIGNNNGLEVNSHFLNLVTYQQNILKWARNNEDFFLIDEWHQVKRNHHMKTLLSSLRRRPESRKNGH